MNFCVCLKKRELDLKISSVGDWGVEAASSVSHKIRLIMNSHSALDLLSKVFCCLSLGVSVMCLHSRNGQYGVQMRIFSWSISWTQGQNLFVSNYHCDLRKRWPLLAQLHRQNHFCCHEFSVHSSAHFQLQWLFSCLLREHTAADSSSVHIILAWIDTVVE